MSAPKFIEYWLEKDSNINTELLEFIKKLQQNSDVKLFIATNQEHNRARYIMENLGFSNYFDDIFHSAKIGHTKKEPAYFQEVDKILGLDNIKPIFFDDTPEIVTVANEHGWDAHEFYDIKSIQQKPAVWVLGQ